MIVLFIVLTFLFIIIRLRGNPIQFIIPIEMTRPEEVARLTELLGFNDPLWMQYLRFMVNAIRGDFGYSYAFHADAFRLVSSRLFASLQLAISAITLAVAVAVPLGILAALQRNRPADILITSLATVGRSMPDFWFGILLILFFAVFLGWLPVSGRSSLLSMIMPTLALAAGPSTTISRLVRSTLLDVLSLDYIRTARAKGLDERTVIFRHALRNALIPVVTVIGMQIPWLFGGAVIIERVFAWPGIGQLMVQAINLRDMSVIQSGTFFITLMILLAALTVDLIYPVLNPTVRFK